ncbi:AbrB family transcriptional regulator [Gloeobacter kilaueensis]|uniref:SpoVT-AbrB domain-containing protein n=1 Tax=Gloeobacter kilaueensis (strain ATCC BAA-2537 / CCAP 1431/1 / ULC 316 / JS1) TaxID=1183438 RepID=U5QFU8_GLOK1|nr:AbrB family transcriptional regulator [Gloeobacter kilaueensis]AGY57807.1 hypothetical protein GKIL_1561 [Gloeobacter kilaueensis JS1]
MGAVTGRDLLQLIKQNPDKSARQLAEIAGYTTSTKSGQQRVKMLAFQKAVLEANNINFKGGEEEVETVRGGRKATYRIQVQQNGNLLIGAAYTRQINLKPGTTFEIQIGRKHLKLVQLGKDEVPVE